MTRPADGRPARGIARLSRGAGRATWRATGGPGSQSAVLPKLPVTRTFTRTPDWHSANLTPLITGQVIRLAERHEKVRRYGRCCGSPRPTDQTIGSCPGRSSRSQ